MGVAVPVSAATMSVMKNAEELIGAPVEIGCIVTPPGESKHAVITGAASGLLGAASRAAGERNRTETADASAFFGGQHRLGYLCLRAGSDLPVANPTASRLSDALGISWSVA